MGNGKFKGILLIRGELVDATPISVDAFCEFSFGYYDLTLLVHTVGDSVAFAYEEISRGEPFRLEKQPR